jgi:hypothetical protein
MEYSAKHYDELLNCQSLPDMFVLIDHLSGFDKKEYNNILHNINADAQQKNKIYNITYHQVLDKSIVDKYQSLDIKFLAKNQDNLNLNKFCNYNVHPKLNYKNFICSFNGSYHVSRKLLVSILEKFKYYNPDYCTKNFSYTTAILDGHINDYVPDRIDLYRKFFISADSEDFFQTVNSFGHVRFEHNKNIYNLENKLTESFLHIVSETMATSYVPFVTEKCLYSIVTRGLFLSYAQPGWHAHIEKYYGFKLYTTLFDYRFDLIQNPVERLVELMTMIGKFGKLTPFEWHDLYLIEQDNVEFNYDHYFSKNYLIELKKYEN